MANDRLDKRDNEKELPKRVDKTLAWLVDSRDKWREKCKEAKLLLKRQTLAVKRLRSSRADWEISNIRLKQELIKNKRMISTLQHRIDELESQISHQNKINIVKKKQ